MNLKEIYQQFKETSESQELRDLFNKSKNKSITDDELVRLDEIVKLVDLKLEVEEKITDSLFKVNKKFQLNNGGVLKITRGRTRDDSGVCFKVSTETKSNKLEYNDLIKAMYGLRLNYHGQVYTEYISDEFKLACDLIISESSESDVELKNDDLVDVLTSLKDKGFTISNNNDLSKITISHTSEVYHYLFSNDEVKKARNLPKYSDLISDLNTLVEKLNLNVIDLKYFVLYSDGVLDCYIKTKLCRISDTNTLDTILKQFRKNISLNGDMLINELIITKKCI
jgi:hypothetical protein